MRCLVCNENGVIVLCFRYKSTVREIAFQRGWSLVVCRTFRDSWLFRGGFANLVLNYPLIGLLAWKVRFVYIEPSTKWGISMEGPALVIEPSSISASTVEGSTLESRTIRDSGPKCGRFASEIWTVRDIESQRGRFQH